MPAGSRSQQAAGVGPLNVGGRDPKLPVVFAAVMDAQDIRVWQSCRQVGFAYEPLPELAITGDIRPQNL